MKNATATAAAAATATANATTVPPAADRLAAYAAGLAYAELPAPIVAAAKTCLIDAASCAIFGADLPWSRAIAGMIAASGSAGPCAVPGFDHRLDPRQAALALGAFAHAFELDSLRKPGAGAHPGATVALPAFAMAQAAGRSGRDLVTAIVAGCEVSFRIGAATLHTPELEGFHAPGIVGPFGAATASGKLLAVSADQLAYAFGIAGSCTGGLLAFARSGRAAWSSACISAAPPRAACSPPSLPRAAMTGRAPSSRASLACSTASARSLILSASPRGSARSSRRASCASSPMPATLPRRRRSSFCAR